MALKGQIQTVANQGWEETRDRMKERVEKPFTQESAGPLLLGWAETSTLIQVKRGFI